MYAHEDGGETSLRLKEKKGGKKPGHLAAWAHVSPLSALHSSGDSLFHYVHISYFSVTVGTRYYFTLVSGAQRDSDSDSYVICRMAPPVRLVPPPPRRCAVPVTLWTVSPAALDMPLTVV